MVDKLIFMFPRYTPMIVEVAEVRYLRAQLDLQLRKLTESGMKG